MVENGSGLEKIVKLSHRDDIGKGGEMVGAVHLCRQRVVNLESLEEIIKSYPCLNTIQTSRSYLRLVNRGFRDKLAERGIELRIGRVKNAQYYDRLPAGDNYFQKRKLFEESLKDEEKSIEIQKMIEYGFVETKIASLYFSGERRAPLNEIAEILGLRYGLVRYRLESFMAWLGSPSNPNAVKGGQFLMVRLQRLEGVRISKEKKERYRQKFAVGDKLPPESLPANRWKIWKIVTEAATAYPQEYLKTKSRYPRNMTILEDYVQLEDITESPQTLEEIGRKYGIHRERTRQIVGEAVGKLVLMKKRVKETKINAPATGALIRKPGNCTTSVTMSQF